jgi:hypothetical protein
MRCLLSIVIGCVVLSCAPGRGAAQVDRSETVGTETLLARNPMLAKVEKSAPDELPSLIVALQRLSIGKRAVGLRNGMVPTNAELAEISANPLFAEAYRQSQPATLALLRSANKALIAAGHGDMPDGQ